SCFGCLIQKIEKEAAASFFLCLRKFYVIDFLSLKSIFLNKFALKYRKFIQWIGREENKVV
ncbi:TPA: hypothetical protein ACFJA0_001490, partial [Neisseria gonorrhoeae]